MCAKVRIAILTLILMLLNMSESKASQPPVPDFAFPKKVEASASVDLAQALRTSDGPAIVNAVIRYSLAKIEVSTDSIPVVLKFVKSTREKAEVPPVAKALLAMLEAKVYTDTYSSNSYVYRERATTEADDVDNITLWNRDKFYTEVLALVNQVEAEEALLKEIPIGEYADCIDYDKSSATFYPTLYDFVAERAIEYLQVFGGGQEVLSEALVADLLNASLYPAGEFSAEGNILRIYRSLIVGRELAAPGINARGLMLNYVLPRVFRSNSQAYSIPAFLRKPDNFRYDVFRRAYNECASSPYAIELLLRAPCNSVDEKTEVYNILKQFERENPKYFNINSVKNRIAEFSQRHVVARPPMQFAKGYAMSVPIESQNVEKAIIKVYRLSENVNVDQWQRVPAAAPIATYSVDFTGTVPFVANANVQISLPEYGAYIIVPEAEGLDSKGSTYQPIRCSDLVAGAFAHVGGITGSVVDFQTGYPIEDAIFTYKSWSRNQGITQLPGRTNADGILNFNIENGGSVAAKKGSDRFAGNFNVYRFNEPDTKRTFSASIQTALKLYRPGDTMEFAAIVTSVQRGESGILEDGKSIKIELLDANWKNVDTKTFTTDRWGRISGRFDLPSTGLTGNYTLRAYFSDMSIGQTSFMVSDYKLPTFAVEISSVDRPAELGQSATIYGNATTFAGFPVGDAEVTMQLRVRSGFWWWATTSPTFYEAKATTDALGNFSVVVPGETIASSPAPRGCFIAEIAVVSPDGETRDATATFNMGKPYSIQIDIPSIYEKGKSRAMVATTDFSGDVAEIGLKYKIYKYGVSEVRASSDEEEAENDTPTQVPDVVGEGVVPTNGNLSEIIESLEQGEYLVAISPIDAELAEPTYSQKFVIYNPQSDKSPVGELLWLPESEVVANTDGVAVLRFATSLENANVLMAVSDEDGKLLQTKMLKGVSGVHAEKVVLPMANLRYRVYLRVVSQGNSASASITILPKNSVEKLSVEIESFRDKVMPLASETISLRIKGLNGANPESAVMLDMANRAIDVLAPCGFNFTAPIVSFRGMTIDGWNFGSAYVSLYQRVNYLDGISVVVPEFQLYGRDFAQRKVLYGTMIRNSMMKRSAPAMGVYDYSEVVEEESVSFTESSMDMVAAADDADAGAGSIETGDQTSSAANEEVYRPSEIPLAFFLPMLVTESDGSLKVEYTVPNANTTWVLRALAYNTKLLSTSAEATIVASKPVMVTVNTPRFLRSGDSVIIQASVMNATDSLLAVTSTIQLLNSSDMSEIAFSEVTDSIEPGGRALISLPYNVVDGANGILCRVKASSGRYTDGEQALIPIQPAAQDVVESQMFYLAPGQSTFEMDINAVGFGGRAYLDFTENPAWQVVSALPGLRDNQIDSSIEAAAALFSAAVADGLMTRYPEIAKALRRWSSNPTDSVLVSELEKNAQLKSILLSDTPWVGDGLSQTERMQRLILLLDKKNTTQVVNDAVARLSRCYSSGGGWSWTSKYSEVSEWATERILDMFGELKQLGFMPINTQLNGMIDGSVKWLDAETVRLYNKYPKTDFTVYAYVRVKFPDIKLSTAASRVMHTAVQRILSGWHDHNVVIKAVDAQILNGNGYNASARQILASLRELSTSSPERGMWWQQLENMWFFSLDKVGCAAILLDAFATVEPNCADIDKIRQWLVLEKSKTDWGNAIITSQVIASILTSGTEWTINTKGTAIRVDGKLLAPSEIESYTGAFVEQITDKVQHGATLHIDRQANYPSFGAVVSMRRLPMDEIKAVGCSELIVKKSLSVMRDGKWVPSESFELGDRVLVSLTVNADADMDYVVIQDARAATFEPVEQLPTPVWSEGLCFYCENRDSQTNLFISRLPRGTYVLAYELFATQSGSFSSGVAQAQSQYNPTIAAHSSGCTVNVSSK